MKTYKAVREFKMDATANSRTIVMKYTRTFNNEGDAVEQVFSWVEEMEANGWSIKSQNNDIVKMTKYNDHNCLQHATLNVMTY